MYSIQWNEVCPPAYLNIHQPHKEVLDAEDFAME